MDLLIFVPIIAGLCVASSLWSAIKYELSDANEDFFDEIDRQYRIKIEEDRCWEKCELMRSSKICNK